MVSLAGISVGTAFVVLVVVVDPVVVATSAFTNSPSAKEFSFSFSLSLRSCNFFFRNFPEFFKFHNFLN